LALLADLLDAPDPGRQHLGLAGLRTMLSVRWSGSVLETFGGFYGAQQPSAELYLRWLQATVFSSHIRLHGIGEREPWAFGAEAEAVARKWLLFRYRLLPYLQRAIADAMATGMPIMRAMPLAFPGDMQARRYETQFMCGDALLVAPIVAAGGEVEIALPQGAWYDINTRQRVAGGSIVRFHATLDQFPVFGREGYALPLGRAVQHTGEIDSEKPLEQLWIFGAPMQPLDGFAQVRIDAATGTPGAVHVAPDVRVERFGDATEYSVVSLDA